MVTCKWTSCPITRHYKDQSAEEILRKLLPIEEIPSGFEIVGTLCHLNLKPDVLPYKYWIGKILMDTHHTLKTVLTKVGTIETVYRTFDYEILAGNDKPGWSITTVQEHNHTFQLDYAKVYWNSRLSGEHYRLVQLILNDANDENVVVADLMAGVGPFAVPLTSYNAQQQGRPNVTVYANDLNPECSKYLRINANKNRCQKLHIFNMDARSFVQNELTTTVILHHAILNLPKTAPEFLNAFIGWRLEHLPMIHVYCFASKQDSTSAVLRCETALGCTIGNPQVYTVRDVSPSQNMYCVSFRLPEAVRRDTKKAKCA